MDNEIERIYYDVADVYDKEQFKLLHKFNYPVPIEGWGLTYDGKHLIFASNRNNGGTRDTNLFIAEWQD